MKPIPAQTRLTAWMEAAEFLLDNGPVLNLVLAIESPGSDGPHIVPVTQRIDEFLVSEEQYPMHTVAETIFPGWQYRRRGLRGVIDTYPNEEYPEIMKAHPNRWGTYAYRLVRRTGADGQTIVPLEQMIKKMRTELDTPGPKKSCYEIGVAEGEYDLPLYHTVGDEERHMGGPCLSHLSFKLFDDAVHLTAFYRSHDYRYKALGNLLGLARLQACVAKEVNLPMGSLVIHSSYAFLNGAKGRVRNLIRNLRNDLTE